MARHDRKITADSDAALQGDPDASETVAPAKGGRRKKVVLTLIAAVALTVGGLFAKNYWTIGRFMVDTDDAYVTADITMISSRVQGYVAGVEVTENQRVEAGDVLVRLDDGDYRIALETAQSRVTTSDETLNRIDAQTDAARASVTQSEAMRDVAAAQLRTARTNSDRITRLAGDSVVSQAQLDTATEALDTATASLASAEAAVTNAEAQVSVLKAQRAEAEGKKRELELAADQARRDLDLTVLRAPADGTLANLTLEAGDLVAPGARLAALVPTDRLYIEANFKETQMADVRPGAEAHLSFDALPGRDFEGRVASIAPATGSVFSLLPAENATGNFTKVVQRVPVRIEIPAEVLRSAALRAGLSVVVEVDSRTGGAATRTAAAE